MVVEDLRSPAEVEHGRVLEKELLESVDSRLARLRRNIQRYKGMFLYSAVSSPLDRSKCFTHTTHGRG